MNETTFRIGFSGHQQLGDETTLKFVSQQLRELLITYQQQACHDGESQVAWTRHVESVQDLDPQE